MSGKTTAMWGGEMGMLWRWNRVQNKGYSTEVRHKRQ